MKCFRELLHIIPRERGFRRTYGCTQSPRREALCHLLLEMLLDTIWNEVFEDACSFLWAVFVGVLVWVIEVWKGKNVPALGHFHRVFDLDVFRYHPLPTNVSECTGTDKNECNDG